LIATFFGQDITLAAPAELFSRDISVNPSLLKVSPAIAKISGTYRGQGGRLIIHIEDAHTNIGGQENLAKILEELIKRYELKTVFVEGGVADSSLSDLRPLASKAMRERVAKKYLMKGLLNGEEYLDLANDYTLKLWGVEDAALYEKNLDEYAAVVKTRDRVLAYLAEIESSISRVKRQLFPKEIMVFDDFLKDFNRQDKDYTQYHETLIEAARRYGIDLAAYPEFVSLKDLKSREDRIDFREADREQAFDRPGPGAAAPVRRPGVPALRPDRVFHRQAQRTRGRGQRAGRGRSAGLQRLRGGHRRRRPRRVPPLQNPAAPRMLEMERQMRRIRLRRDRVPLAPGQALTSRFPRT